MRKLTKCPKCQVELESTAPWNPTLVCPRCKKDGETLMKELLVIAPRIRTKEVPYIPMPSFPPLDLTDLPGVRYYTGATFIGTATIQTSIPFVLHDNAGVETISQMKKYAQSLTKKILVDYKLRHRIRTTNKRATYHKCQDDVHTITYGWALIRKDVELGFLDYKSWRWLWGTTPFGLKAVWAIVLHEVAHAIQVNRGLRGRRSVHNNGWGKIVRELQELYPFEEI